MSEKTFFNLDAAYEMAREKMASADIEKQCLYSGAIRDNPNRVNIDFMYENYTIDVTSSAVKLTSTDRDVPLRSKILILHYFLQAINSKLTNEHITYRQLPGGLIYYPTFMQRTVKRLTDAFGNKIQDFIAAGLKVGADIGREGDASLVIRAFPRVSVNLVLWQGDNELPPQLNILFDDTISDYLEPEDVTVMCEIIVGRLITAAGKNA